MFKSMQPKRKSINVRHLDLTKRCDVNGFKFIQYDSEVKNTVAPIIIDDGEVKNIITPTLIDVKNTVAPIIIDDGEVKNTVVQTLTTNTIALIIIKD